MDHFEIGNAVGDAPMFRDDHVQSFFSRNNALYSTTYFFATAQVTISYCTLL